MKILHIESGKNLCGGALQALWLMQHLKGGGTENVLVADPASGIAEAARANGIMVIPITMRGKNDPLLPIRIGQAIRAIRPDIVHVHSRRGVDFWGGWVSHSMRVPAVLSCWVDTPPSPGWMPRLKYRPYDRIMAMSEGLWQRLLSEDRTKEKLVLARSAIDFDAFPEPVSRSEFLQRFDLKQEHLVIGCVAPLHAIKGHRYLIEALSPIVQRHPNLRMLFLGKGEEETPLREQVRKTGLEHVVLFPGWILDLKSLMPHFDVLVHPALEEGLGLSLIEASFCRVPVVATRAGGIPAIVHDQKNGFLVEPGDPAALSKALRFLCDHPDMRMEMGNQGRLLAMSEFGIKAMVAQNLQMYCNLLNN